MERETKHSWVSPALHFGCFQQESREKLGGAQTCVASGHCPAPRSCARETQSFLAEGLVTVCPGRAAWLDCGCAYCEPLCAEPGGPPFSTPALAAFQLGPVPFKKAFKIRFPLEL